MVWALHLDKASPDLRALLKLPETLPSMPFERRIKARPDDRHGTTATDKQRIIAAILAHPKGACARAAAFRVAAMQPHKVGTGWQRFSERPLRDWVQAAESGGVAALMPVAWSDKGKRRVRITREWQDGCGLSADVQDGIAAKLEGIARGLILKGRSGHETRRLASTELQRLSVAAGVTLPKAQLAHLCALTGAWVMPFAEMTVARDYLSDHKRYSDNHKARVHRELTRFPMEVLMGDVLKVDMQIADDLKSHDPREWIMAQEAKRNGREMIRVAIIAWMDGSSHFMWATPVILGQGQGITQQDVARSLYSVITCPHGGIPREILIDNGSEYKALAEAVARFIVIRNAAGYLTKGATAAGAMGVGRADATVDNTGAAGALSLEYSMGIFRFANSAAGDLIAIAGIGKSCFIVDDQTPNRRLAPRPMAPPRGHARASWMVSKGPAYGCALMKPNLHNHPRAA